MRSLNCRTSQRVGGEVLTAAERSTEEYYHALADLDFWLRADGRKRNPGTTADLICTRYFSRYVTAICSRRLYGSRPT